MISLPANCRAGDFSIYPRNWKTVRADIKKEWRVSYYFYDDNLKQKLKVVIKSGINRLRTLKEKQAAIELFIADEIDLIQRRGYNKITKTYAIINENEITSFTLFIDALNYSFKSLTVDKATLADIKSCLKYVTLAIQSLRFDTLTIGAVRLKHFILIFEECSRTMPRWSASRHNHYRTYLFILLKKLVLLGVVEANYLRDMPVQKSVKKIRETLTKEERGEVGIYLQKNHYYFWRFIVLFFHSGARFTELLRLKAKDVNINDQKYKVLVKKGNQSAEKYRIIKTIAIDLWREVLSEAKPNDYLFSIGLKPGSKQIRREQISRRWKRHVKDKLGFSADNYSLKHSNLDEISELIGIEKAQKMAGHSTPVITLTYATGEAKRKDEELKKVNNPF